MNGDNGAGRLRAAVIQMCSGDDVDTNLDRARRWLERAAAEGADVALLPENFAFMGEGGQARLAVAEPETDSRVVRFLAETARRLDMAIMGGGVPLRHPDGRRVRNACPALSRQGALLGVYDKMHLFDVDLPEESHRESETTAAGDAPLAVRIGSWRLGLSICYDLRFPELYRRYAGCEAVCVAAAFTVPTGEAHWETLLRARAVENQCFVLAAAQFGEHPGGRRTWGHSMIVDPWGEIVAGPLRGEGVAWADLSMARLASVRQVLPALKHRRTM